jgi:type I restriction enzyme R subunit
MMVRPLLLAEREAYDGRMTDFQPIPYHLFDPKAEWSVVDRRLPHWSQAGAVCFLTRRTDDSMPKAVLHAWHEERRHWLRRHGIDSEATDWRDALNRLDRHDVREFLDTHWNHWHDELDSCHGACPLKARQAAQIVGNSLMHFDCQRYLLFDWVVMPNHVHILAAFPDEQTMLAQCESWKHFTAARVNKLLGQRGRFWQVDGFDHLLRSEEQFHWLRQYIADNPRRANLRAGQFLHYSRPLP